MVDEERRKDLEKLAEFLKELSKLEKFLEDNTPTSGENQEQEAEAEPEPAVQRPAMSQDRLAHMLIRMVESNPMIGIGTLSHEIVKAYDKGDLDDYVYAT